MIVRPAVIVGPAVIVRPVVSTDAGAWLQLRRQLWPEGAEAEHRDEIAAYLAGTTREPAAVLVAEHGGVLAGFAELSIRPYAEGCVSGRVCFLEGWFVSPERRRQGLGRALVRASESWGRAQGCTEFASDTLPDNHGSIAAHAAIGFENVGMVVCFRKAL